MSQPRDDRQDDLFRASLEAIINLRHPLVRHAAEIDWDFLAKRFSSVCRLGPGQPPLPTRLVAGLFILKHMHNLSDERGVLQSQNRHAEGSLPLIPSAVEWALSAHLNWGVFGVALFFMISGFVLPTVDWILSSRDFFVFIRPI